MSRKEIKEYNQYIRGILPGLAGGYDLQDKAACRYSYTAQMLQRTQQMFEWRGLPDTIPARMLELYLQVNGYTCIADAGGLYAFFGGLGGVPDAYYQPTECIVNNPALDFNKVLKINEDCVIIRNDAMYAGLMPIFDKYAGLLVESDLTFRIMSINGRIAEVISAADDSTKAAAEKYLKDIEEGKLGVIGEQPFFDGVKVQAAAAQSATRVTDLIEYHQYLKASWYNDIGLQANYNMKREALNSDEVQLNIKALLPLCENMLACRKEGAEAVNAMFGTSIGVDFAGVWQDTLEEVEQLDQITEEPEKDQEPEKPEEVNENEETN